MFNIDKFIAQRFYNDFLTGISPLKIHKNNNRLSAFNVATSQLQHITNKPEIYGAGGSLSRHQAIVASIGESIERICLNKIENNLICATYDSIAENAIDPQKLYGYSEDTYNKLNIDKYNPHEKALWYKCKNLVSGRFKYIPACNIWTNFHNNKLNLPIWDIPVSTGTSAHYEKEKTIISGILEIIERDTFSLYWENNISGVQRELPTKVNQLIEYLNKNHLDCNVIYLPNEFGVPVACCIICDNSGRGPFTSFGAGAKLTWEEAALRSIEEAILTFTWMTSRLNSHHKCYDDLITLLSNTPEPVVHADIYAGYQINHHYRSLINEKNLYKNKVPQIVNYNQLLERLTSKGFEIYIADITLPEFKNLGYTVNRVIIPGLVPLSRGFFLRHINNPRHINMLENSAITDHKKKEYFVHPLP